MKRLMQRERNENWNLSCLYRHKIEYNIFTTEIDCICYLYYFESIIFKQIIYFFVYYLLIKIWLCDNQSLIVKLPKQRRVDYLNNSIY